MGPPTWVNYTSIASNGQAACDMIPLGAALAGNGLNYGNG